MGAVRGGSWTNSSAIPGMGGQKTVHVFLGGPVLWETQSTRNLVYFELVDGKKPQRGKRFLWKGVTNRDIWSGKIQSGGEENKCGTHWGTLLGVYDKCKKPGGTSEDSLGKQPQTKH